MRSDLKQFVVLIFLIFLSTNAFAQKVTLVTTNPADGLDEFIRSTMEELNISSSISVGVVKGDRVIFAKGFGYRDVESRLPATTQTLYYIASSTKAFTGTAAKILAEENKLDLDVPIRKYFPGLKLESPLTTDHISLRDLLTHGSGMDNDPIVFRNAYTGQYTSMELFEMFNQSVPVTRAFKYSNIGYVVAGYAIESVTGKTWQQILKEKIFDPIGMKSTTCFVSEAKETELALPYQTKNGRSENLPFVKGDNTMHAAGGMFSNIDDLTKWLIVNLNDGKYEDKQIVSKTALEEIHSPQVNLNRKFYMYRRYAYGLGWYLSDYEGDKLLHCFGSFPIYRPHMSFMPEHKIGVVVLSNDTGEEFFIPDLIASYVYDKLLGKENIDEKYKKHKAEYKKLIQKRKERLENFADENESKRDKNTQPSFALTTYSGKYRNSEYGEMYISANNGSLNAVIGNLSSPLVHYHHDIFEANLIPGDMPFKLEFISSESGRITEFFTTIWGNEVSFDRVPED